MKDLRSQPTIARRGPRRRFFLTGATAVVAAVALLVGSGAFGRLASPAAAYKECPEGGRPPCGIDRPTTTTTVFHPTWQVPLLNLVEDPAQTGPLTADRYWLGSTLTTVGTTPISVATARQAAPQAAPSSVLTNFLTIVATKSAPLSGGAFTFPADPLPAGNWMSMRIREGGAPGSVCRTPARSTLPPSGTQLHVLVPAPFTETAADLNAMVATFHGDQTGLPAGTSMNIWRATLTPQAGGLMLRLQGVLQVNDWIFGFDFHLLMTLAPDNGLNTSSVFQMQAAAPGTMNLTWASTPPANADAIRLGVASAAAVQTQTAVLAQATPLVNSTVNGLHDLRWWTDQGFTVSARRVTYSDTGMQVSVGLCRLG